MFKPETGVLSFSLCNVDAEFIATFTMARTKRVKRNPACDAGVVTIVNSSQRAFNVFLGIKVPYEDNVEPRELHCLGVGPGSNCLPLRSTLDELGDELGDDISRTIVIEIYLWLYLDALVVDPHKALTISLEMTIGQTPLLSF